jgi:hypothetical protein
MKKPGQSSRSKYDADREKSHAAAIVQRHEQERLLFMAEQGSGWDTNKVILLEGESVFVEYNDVGVVGQLPASQSNHRHGVSARVPFTSVRVYSSSGGRSQPASEGVIDFGTLFVTNQRVIVAAQTFHEMPVADIARVSIAPGSRNLYDAVLQSRSGRTFRLRASLNTSARTVDYVNLVVALAHGRRDEIIAEFQKRLSGSWGKG